MNMFTSTLAPAYMRPAHLVKRTENGMRARANTANACVDLFSSIAALRGRNVEIQQKFIDAYNENKDAALRILQWARDVRGGAGERNAYRVILKLLEDIDPQLLVESKLLDNVANIGRFDDLLIFSNHRVKEKAFRLIAKALAEGNGLAAKWMPRKGAIAVELREFIGLTPREYRKLLVRLTNVVETQMCAREFDQINFSHVPSVAMTKYMTAFHKRAPEAFQAYKEALKGGTAKVNAGAVYPYSVIQALDRGDREVATAMWDSLPDYMDGTSVLPMIDVSASMTWTEVSKGVQPYHIATSLGLYCADKNKGAFKDIVAMFTTDAQLVKLQGSISDKVNQIKNGTVHGSTNLHAAFDSILRHALAVGAPASDMPKMILILSDMQFNSCVRHDDSALQMIRRKYEDAGYEMPAIVFWNLNDRGNTPAKYNDSGVALVSGFSPALMKSLLAADLNRFTPESMMLETIGVDRYSW